MNVIKLKPLRSDAETVKKTTEKIEKFLLGQYQGSLENLENEVIQMAFTFCRMIRQEKKSETELSL